MPLCPVFSSLRRACPCGAALLSTLLAACHGNDPPTEAGTCTTPGAAAPGAADTHCDLPDGGSIVQPTDTPACMEQTDAAPEGDDGGGGPDADIGNCNDPTYGATMYGQSGSDDDCKYDVAWTSTPICLNEAVYFTVKATRRTDGSTLEGANPRPDVVLDCNHPISSHPADPSPEVAPGTYLLGPVVFDLPGRWVVRFHFYEGCYDLVPDSPHGHAAFYVDVPGATAEAP